MTAIGRPLGARDRRGRCVRAVPKNEARHWLDGVGEAIRHCREEQDVSALELAAAIGVCDKTIHAWERGRIRPRLLHVYSIAVALGIQLNDLLEGP